MPGAPPRPARRELARLRACMAPTPEPPTRSRPGPEGAEAVQPMRVDDGDESTCDPAGAQSARDGRHG